VKVAKKYDGKPAALEAHRYLAARLGNSKRPEDVKTAAGSLEYLVGHGQRDPETLNNYAWLLVTNGRQLEKAQSLAQEAVKAAPKASHILDTLAECYSRLGRKDEAVSTEKKAIECASPQEKPMYEKRLAEIEAAKSKSF
jgi:tetratricopeptide (TPR) repeat protein